MTRGGQDNAAGSCRILLEGVADGHDPAAVKDMMARTYRLPMDKVELMFARAPVPVKSGLDEATAVEYCRRLEQAGVRCRVDPPSAAPPDGGEDAALKAFRKEVKAVHVALWDLGQEVREKGEYTQSADDAVMPAVGAGALFWLLVSFGAGLVVGVIVYVLLAIYHGQRAAQAEAAIARQFSRRLFSHPRRTDPVFLAILGDWLENSGGDSYLKDAPKLLASLIAPARGDPAFLDCQARLAELEQHRKKREQAARERKESLAAARLGGAIAVPGHNLDLHGGGPQTAFGTFSASWSFAVSDSHFCILDGDQVLMRLPMDCIRQVQIGGGGLSAAEIASALLNPLFGVKTERVRVDFNIAMHWIPLRGVGSHVGTFQWRGISFEIKEEDWNKCAHQWQAFAAREFPAGARCPVCEWHAVDSDPLGLLEKSSLKEPRLTATCAQCHAKLEFDLTAGEFRRKARQ